METTTYLNDENSILCVILLAKRKAVTKFRYQLNRKLGKEIAMIDEMSNLTCLTNLIWFHNILYVIKILVLLPWYITAVYPWKPIMIYKLSIRVKSCKTFCIKINIFTL